ncbi:MAG UNVERIFIED_CONTAM: hypothetical protein LVR18_27220 [Planctomycetaceae bacterium]|jgi:hypothetical protein
MSALDILGLLNNTKTMIAGLAAWQSVCNVTTSAEAGSRIYLGGVEAAPEDDTSPLCWLDVNPATFDWMGTSRGRVTVEAVFEIGIPTEEQVTFQREFRYAWTQASAILAGINGAVNGSGQLMMRSLTMPLRPGLINPEDNDGRHDWRFTLGLVIEVV